MTILSIATFNLRHSADQWLRRRQLVVEQLLLANPDVIALQEIAFPIGQGIWLRNQLNARSAESPYKLVQKRRAHPFYFFVEGVGILSRLPIISYDAISLGYQGRVAVRANLELPTGETLDFVSTHLYSAPHAHQVRAEQVMRLLGWLHGRSAVNHRVVAGTFRAFPDSLAIQRVKQFYSYRSAYEVVNRHEPLATYPTVLSQMGDNVGMCHDYIFVSPQIKQVLEAGVCCCFSAENDPTLYPSDHIGLITKINVGDE